MSVYKDKKEWNKWNEMVKASKDADDRFYAMPDDDAILQADKKIQSLLSKNYTLQQENTKLREELDLFKRRLINSTERREDISKVNKELVESVKKLLNAVESVAAIDLIKDDNYTEDLKREKRLKILEKVVGFLPIEKFEVKG